MNFKHLCPRQTVTQHRHSTPSHHFFFKTRFADMCGKTPASHQQKNTDWFDSPSPVLWQAVSPWCKTVAAYERPVLNLTGAWWTQYTPTTTRSNQTAALKYASRFWKYNAHNDSYILVRWCRLAALYKQYSTMQFRAEEQYNVHCNKDRWKISHCWG